MRKWGVWGIAAVLLLAAGAGATTLSTSTLTSLNPSDLFRCDVTNLSETKTLTAHVELIDFMGVVRETGDLVIPPLVTLEVAANSLQLAGRWCRITFSGNKNKVRASLNLFDGTRESLSLEAH
jgi:hypothetical protein